MIKTFAVGHTFTICDTFYGIIENKSYKKQLEIQRDWEHIMNICNIETFNIPQEQFYAWNWLNDLFKTNK